MKGLAWQTEFQNASVVCPDRVRPDASVMVPEIMTGSVTPVAANAFLTAKMAALAFNVSKIVSIIKKSTPPSINATADSSYVEASSSKLIFRKPGSFTSGDIEAVRLVGPSTPDTYRGEPTLAAYASAHSRANRAAAVFNSRTSDSRP